MCALGSKGVTIVSRTTWQQILYKMHKPQKLKAKPLDGRGYNFRIFIIIYTLYIIYNSYVFFKLLEPGGIDHSESSRNNQSELIRNSQCTCLAN